MAASPLPLIPMSIARVGIVGSGIMGAGIAEAAAVSGFEVILSSRSQSTADATVSTIEKSLNRQIDKGKRTEAERDAALGLITAASGLNSLKSADLVIESVIEDLGVKKALFNDLDRITGPEAILATNTSTLPVIDLAMQTGRPELVCGVHFFNPAPVMDLVEVVRPLTASDETIATALAFAEACGKTPVEVKDQAGFIVNALLFPYLNNAVRLHEQGVAAIADIDTAMKGGCGFPMGPFALLDLVGLDTSLAILDALYEEFKDPNYSAVPLLRRMVTAELLGRKSGQGFFDYRK
jgi:3-hydroxybutyryl-CoA dehydrogenase